MALDDHLALYLGEQDAALAKTLLELRHWAIWCLNELGDSFAQAIEYGRSLVADRERDLGETHPDTLKSRGSLAVAYLGAGRLEEAIPLFERTLTDREKVLGETHPITLVSRNNVASAYQDAGRLEEAIALFERTLTDREKVQGATHPDTLTSRNRTSLSPTSAPGGWRRPSRCSNAPSPTANRSWAKPTLTRWAPATTSAAPIGTRGGWRRPSRCSSAPSPTSGGSWARPTPIR